MMAVTSGGAPLLGKCYQGQIFSMNLEKKEWDKQNLHNFSYKGVFY
jgi:hypothetical protein